MCGLVGYVGSKGQIIHFLIQALKRLEYRGYDSAGVCLVHCGLLIVRKAKGKIAMLEPQIVDLLPLQVQCGMAHTRWATHGEPSQVNAHPLEGCNWNGGPRISVVHNGIIENYKSLKKELLSRGHVFTSDTDSEVIVHLIEENLHDGNDFHEAVRLALSMLRGAYAILAVMSTKPDVLIAARKDSPLRIGIGKNDGTYYVASDAMAFAHVATTVVELMNDEVACITPEGFSIKSVLDSTKIDREAIELEWDPTVADRGEYDHYMEAEIHEQPDAITNSMRGRVVLTDTEARIHLGGLFDHREILRGIKRITITACGTSWHAGIIGQYLIEKLARIPVRIEYASEFRYRSPIIEDDTLVIVISQSGETADTLAALHEAKRFGAPVMGICNTVGSSIARETDFGVYLHGGPEIGVASTKAFTCQVTVLFQFAIMLAQLHGRIAEEYTRGLLVELKRIPELVATMLVPEFKDHIRSIASAYSDMRNFMYLGRGINFPVALEGALKLKEISYIHAEGYPAAEMKHGPIALIDPSMPSVGIALKSDPLYEKIISNLKEVGARTGPVIVIAEDGDEDIVEPENDFIKHIVRVPRVSLELSPLVTVIPLQLLAYEIAKLLGRSIDMPRNLAKSVTVE